MIRLPNIEDAVWAARPLLKAIREFAHLRVAAADAVLWCVLISEASAIPASVSYDSGIGVPARPTLFGALVGPSGVGKSISHGVAREMCRNAPEPLPLSTGEGLVESYWGKIQREQPQPDGKTKLITVRERVRSNALFWLDEGEALFRQIERPGNVVAPTLRAYWSGGTVGQQNASDESRRLLEAGSYTGGLIVGLQPDISGQLLADTATGTAQRFVWVAATDRHIPDTVVSSLPPVVPSWTRPMLPGQPTGLLEQVMSPTAVSQPTAPEQVLMPLAGSVAAGLRRHQVALRRGDVVPDEHDTQRSAMQLKISGVLAWLDGRLSIEAEDWELAGALLGTSDEVRDQLLEHADEVRARQWTQQGVARSQVQSAAARADVMRERCRDRVVVLLAERGELTHRELSRRTAVAQRPFLPEALGILVDEKAVTVIDTGNGGRSYRVGGDRE